MNARHDAKARRREYGTQAESLKDLNPDEEEDPW